MTLNLVGVFFMTLLIGGIAEKSPMRNVQHMCGNKATDFMANVYWKQ